MTFSRLLVSGLLLAPLAAGACSKDNPATPSNTTTCSFSVAPPNVSTFPPEGGTGTVAVTAGSSCAWTAVSNSSFITITAGSTGTSNGSVSFTVVANTGAERTGTLGIAGTTTTITQRAGSPAPPAAVTFAAPTPRSPIGNVESSSVRPTLVVDNAAATGNPGTVTYRFELSDQSAMTDTARIIAVDGIPQGSTATSWTVDRDLSVGTHYFWRARATNGTVIGPFSNIDTFTTPGVCAYTLTPTSAAVNASGGTTTIGIAVGAACTWTAVSNATFITVNGAATGTGNGTVTLTVAANSGTAARTGTVTIANQTFTVTQAGGGLIASFRLFDPGRQTDPVTECQIKSLTSVPTLCILESTSIPTGTNTLSSFTWTVSYNYPVAKTFTQTGTNPRFQFTELCGQAGSTDSGTQSELQVTLTVIDSAGTSVTVTSNSGTQPLLTLRAYLCGI
jgi:hypothetical protein